MTATSAYQPGDHVALKRPARFRHPTDAAFLCTARRVVVVLDRGTFVRVRPVATKTGADLDLPERAVYSLARGRILGPWTLLSGAKACDSCRGFGMVADDKRPTTESQRQALVQIRAPYCKGKRGGCNGFWSGRETVEYRKGWYSLNICGDCGRIRRNRDAARLRRAYTDAGGLVRLPRLAPAP